MAQPKGYAAFILFPHLKTVPRLKLKVAESAFEEIVLKAAQGQIGKDMITGFFRKHTRS